MILIQQSPRPPAKEKQVQRELPSRLSVRTFARHRSTQVKSKQKMAISPERMVAQSFRVDNNRRLQLCT